MKEQFSKSKDTHLYVSRDRFDEEVSIVYGFSSIDCFRDSI